MNKRATIFLVIACVFAFGLLWWLSKHSAHQIAPSRSPTATPSSAGTFAKPSLSTSDSWPKMPYQGVSDPRWTEMNRREKEDPSWEWKMPISFYGKIVDEKMQPTAGAKVDFQWSDLSKKGASEKTVYSDDQGLFLLSGVKGKGITVRVSKEGYYQTKSSRAVDFEYADFSAQDYYEPDPNNPVIFHLRKIGAGEPMVSGRVSVSVPPNGMPVKVDLLNKGSLSANGQLEISAVTNTEKYPPRFFDWQASVSVPNGGMLEQNDEFPFEAPAAGYIPQVQFNYPASDTTVWKGGVHKNYYITFGSPPKYGRIDISLNGDSQHVNIRYWINPSGSQNLEPSQQSPVP